MLKTTLPVGVNFVARCYDLPLPVVLNIVARGFPKRWATKFTFITMVFHADGRRISLCLLRAAATGRNDFFWLMQGKICKVIDLFVFLRSISIRAEGAVSPLRLF